MEHLLRCNALKCRKELNDQAVVTTCSHIFCLDCTSRLRLSNPPQDQHPKCPACETYLVNPDDAVVTNLNPTEDYKTSVLSGLSPNIIMECTGRALGFWAYQTTQEIVYQEFLARSLTEKYNDLNLQTDKIIHDANAEISSLRDRMDGMVIAQGSLQRKNEELLQAYREKSRKHMQTQELYDKLKRRAMLGQVQDAASDVVDNIEASAINSRFLDQPGNLERRPSRSFLNPGPQVSNLPQACIQGNSVTRSMQPPAGGGGAKGPLTAFSSQEGNHQNGPAQTPSSHRQRWPNGAHLGIGLANLQSSNTSIISTPLPHRRVTPARQPLSRLSPNSSLNAGYNFSNRLAGYGISSGTKISQPPDATQRSSNTNKPIIGSRVAQRLTSTFDGGRSQVYETLNTFGQGGGHY